VAGVKLIFWAADGHEVIYEGRNLGWSEAGLLEAIIHLTHISGPVPEDEDSQESEEDSRALRDPMFGPPKRAFLRKQPAMRQRGHYHLKNRRLK
jgi:hypothetical protein